MSKLNDYNDILTLNELQEILVIGKNKAYELCKSGKIKAFRVDKGWRIPKTSVEEYINKKIGDLYEI